MTAHPRPVGVRHPLESKEPLCPACDGKGVPIRERTGGENTSYWGRCSLCSEGEPSRGMSPTEIADFEDSYFHHLHIEDGYGKSQAREIAAKFAVEVLGRDAAVRREEYEGRMMADIMGILRQVRAAE